METTLIHVNGMMCTHCKAQVEKICQTQPGVTSAVVDLKEKTVTVTGSFDKAALCAAITAADFQVVD